MTDIPGSGRLQSEIKKEIPDEKPQIISTVNVEEIKKKDRKKERPEDKVWYNTLWAWVLFGILGSLIFVILSLINKRFLIFTPIGPVAAILGWYIKKLARRFENNNKSKKY